MSNAPQVTKQEISKDMLLLALEDLKGELMCMALEQQEPALMRLFNAASTRVPDYDAYADQVDLVMEALQTDQYGTDRACDALARLVETIEQDKKALDTPEVRAANDFLGTARQDTGELTRIARKIQKMCNR